MRCRGAFGVQRFALLHAETVLFVDDRQREVGRLEGFGERGVRGHHDAWFAGGRLREDASAGGEFHAAGEQQYGNVRQAVRLAVQQFLHLAAIRLSTVLRFRRVSRRDLSTFIHNRMVR